MTRTSRATLAAADESRATGHRIWTPARIVAERDVQKAPLYSALRQNRLRSFVNRQARLPDADAGFAAWLASRQAKG